MGDTILSVSDALSRFSKAILQERSSTVLVAFFLSASLVSETLLALTYGLYALTGFLIAVVVMTVGAGRLGGEAETLSFLALIPAFRIVNLEFPMIFQSQLVRLTMLYVVFFPSIVFIVITQPRIFQRGREAIGNGNPSQTEIGESSSTRYVDRLGTVLRTRAFIWFVPGIALAVALAEVEYDIFRPAPLINAGAPTDLVVLFVLTMGVGSIVEETMFRGILQRTLQKFLGRWVGILLASVLYGVMFSMYGLQTEIALGVAVGLLLGLLYERTDSLALITIVHWVQSILLLAFIPLYGSVW